MEYFPLTVDEQSKMIAMMIRKFVDEEIMPVRDQLDDDIDHVIINKILTKLSHLGVLSVAP